MAADLPMILPKKAQEGVLEFSRQCASLSNQNYNIRGTLEEIDRLYQREVDNTKEQSRAKTANAYGDPTKFQNIVVPVVMPAVEAAVTYQTSVFLTGVPLFGVSAAPQYIEQAMQLETVIDSQATRGGWTSEFIKFFRDGFKYNLAALEVSWERRKTAVLETDVAFSKKEAKQTEIIWEGNRVKRLDMYNTFFDTRVSPTKIHEQGEFAGYTEYMSRVALKQFIASLPMKLTPNITAAFESGTTSSGLSTGGMESFYIPSINPASIIDPNKSVGTNWMAWAGMADAKSKIAYKDGYEVTTLYGRIIPSDFGLDVPAKNTPQVWKFIIVNHQVLIYAERQTNAHGFLPILFSQPLEDGLDYQTKSLATNVAPIQAISTALANSGIASRRRAISDRTLYDPSRIDAKHINNENPSAKIPVKPAAYGKNVAESVHQFPFRDDQAGLITQEINQYRAMGNEITGQNPVRQGQFVKGNKSRKEFSDVMANANGRDQTVSILLEAQIFTPLKEILKINTLQYQGGTSLYNRASGEMVKVDPVALRKAVLDFKVSDGLTPTDKLMNTDVSMVALQQIGASPAIQQEYNVGPMFSYLMKLQGAQLTAFEKSAQQKAYEQAMGSWNQRYSELTEMLKTTLKGMEVEAMSKQIEAMAKMLPPQPKPEDFGYQPAQQAAPTNTGAAAPSQESGAQ